MYRYSNGSISIAIVLLSFLIITPSYSQTEIDSLKQLEYKKISEQIVSSALKERKGYEALQNLCRIGPRLSGSRNSLIAINWAKNKMIEMGFDSVWLQPVMVPHWERGTIQKAMMMNSKDFNGIELNILTLGGSIGTPPEGIAASVIEVKSFDELEKRKDEAKGKIVFFSRAADQTLLNTFSGYGSAVDQRVYGASEGAKYGAVGIIVRSVTTKFDNVPHTGVMLYVDSLPRIPGVAVGYQDADLLSAALKKDPELKLALQLNCEMLPDAQSYNVIGEIRGTEYSDEIVVVGGHLDSWDVGDGAHDNGAGCMQAIEVVDLFKRLNIKPKRTIRTVLFINEENGSRGAKEYGVYAQSSEQIHLAAIESDRGAFNPVGFNVDTDSTKLIEKIESWLPYFKLAGISWVKKGGSGADISKIENAKLLIGYVPDNQRYFDIHHSPSDVFEEVHPREFELGTAAMAILVYLLSEEGL
ncbi:MAG: M28 family peptidase [Ignavibacteriaceae bacterium]